MDVKEAEKIIESFPPEFNALALPNHYYSAKSFLDFRDQIKATGVKEALESSRSMYLAYDAEPNPKQRLDLFERWRVQAESALAKLNALLGEKP
jgi:hypothetical protein